METVIVIPVRFKSNRFEGKALTTIRGRSMIEWTWLRCTEAMDRDRIFVATDDDRIADHCRGLGMSVIMTSDDCLTGTDRIYEASQQLDADVFINVQGDEPIIDPEDIRAVIDAAKANPGEVINAMAPILTAEDFRRSSVPKVVARPDGRLMYMSRAAIPTGKDLGFAGAMKQICIYAFPREPLAAFAGVEKKTPMESIEDIEILRFLELGYEVKMVEVDGTSFSVDYPEDVARVEAVWDARY